MVTFTDMPSRVFIFAALLLGTVGCMSEKRTYQVSVQNQLSVPITVWLVKENGPAESKWLSPEDIGMANPISDENLPDIVVPPGKTATRPPLEGKFDKDRGRAYLRVYQGTPSLTEMLASDKGEMNRLDLLLDPGVRNDFVVDDHAGYLSATKIPATEPSSGSTDSSSMQLHQLP